jgi:hypothetical protein
VVHAMKSIDRCWLMLPNDGSERRCEELIYMSARLHNTNPQYSTYANVTLQQNLGKKVGRADGAESQLPRTELSSRRLRDVPSHATSASRKQTRGGLRTCQ